STSTMRLCPAMVVEKSAEKSQDTREPLMQLCSSHITCEQTNAFHESAFSLPVLASEVDLHDRRPSRLAGRDDQRDQERSRQGAQDHRQRRSRIRRRSAEEAAS